MGRNFLWISLETVRHDSPSQNVLRWKMEQAKRKKTRKKFGTFYPPSPHSSQIFINLFCHFFMINSHQNPFYELHSLVRLWKMSFSFDSICFPLNPNSHPQFFIANFLKVQKLLEILLFTSFLCLHDTWSGSVDIVIVLLQFSVFLLFAFHRLFLQFFECFQATYYLLQSVRRVMKTWSDDNTMKIMTMKQQNIAQDEHENWKSS